MKIVKQIKELYRIVHDLNRERYDARSPKVVTGKLLAELNSKKEKIGTLHEVEFKVFSQWGDDGIIQHLVSRLDIPSKTFVEFGVENYTESNTRFLLINNNWSGLVIDGSEKNISYIKKDPLYWQYELHAKKAFITAENIEGLIDEAGFGKEIGILSIDIDGNDYMVWKAIKKYEPSIVVIEYNSTFGHQNPWVIPYDPAFARNTSDSRKLYWGASLLSLCDLAAERNYDFIGCNLNGNNAYFIKKELNKSFSSLTCEEGFVDAKFREYFDKGEPVSGYNKLTYLKGSSVFNTRTGAIEKIQ